MELAKFVGGDTELTHIVTKAMTHGPELERADKHRLEVVFFWLQCVVTRLPWLIMPPNILTLRNTQGLAVT